MSGVLFGGGGVSKAPRNAASNRRCASSLLKAPALSSWIIDGSWDCDVPKAIGTPVATIGQCIYCLNRRGPLTEEHILAANLGGKSTLLEASCRRCQTIVDEF